MVKSVCALAIAVLVLFPGASSAQEGPLGYTYCANDGGSYTLSSPNHLAFGDKGKYVFRYNQTGTIKFVHDSFPGADPAAACGGPRYGFYKKAGGETTTQLSGVLTRMKNHLTGATPITTGAQFNALKDTVLANYYSFGLNSSIITQALDLIRYYDSTKGAIFLSAATKNGFPNTPEAVDGHELVRAMFAIQQGAFDRCFTPENVELYPNLFSGMKFASSTYFPGPCPAPTNPATAYSVTINASLSKFWGIPTAYATRPARRPTGCYLAPGSVATVTVPSGMVNKGFSILVGAHSIGKDYHPTVKRFFRMSNSFPITKTTTRIANPFGGNIYIVVPYLASLGSQTVQIANVVRSPFFSFTSSRTTTLQQWLTVERLNPGPWADFESDKFMMQVPTSWIYNFSSPVKLLMDWDKCMDGYNLLYGFPAAKRNQTVQLYLQPDVHITHCVYGIGYPQVNDLYNPLAVTNGNSDFWYFSPGPGSNPTCFHEMGHAQLRNKFPGEEEAEVNFPYCFILNSQFGWHIDSAFNVSFGYNTYRTRDQAARNWSVTHNFRVGNPMDISNSEQNEVRYQHRGYAKYAEITALFGWHVLYDFNYQENVDYEAGKSYKNAGVDSRIFRLSKAAGVDLRPLIHFWGVQPVNFNALRDSINAAGLLPSAPIYDRLVHYKGIIPRDSAAFRTHAIDLFPPTGPRANQNPNYGEGWYYSWLPRYKKAHGDSAVIAMQKIIDLYFPNSRPPETLYTITTTRNVNGGTVLPGPGAVSVSKRLSQTFAITADSAYLLDSVVVDGVNRGALTSYTFSNVTANHALKAWFSKKAVTALLPPSLPDSEGLSLAVAARKGAVLITYCMPQPGAVEISLFSTSGRRVFNARETHQAPGIYSLRVADFHGAPASGIYAVRMQSNACVLSKRLCMSK